MILHGYTRAHVARIKQQLDHYPNVREIVRSAANQNLDPNAYEADM